MNIFGFVDPVILKSAKELESTRKRGTFMQSVLHSSLGVGGSRWTRIGSERQLME
jgi:hypothetical protein